MQSSVKKHILEQTQAFEVTFDTIPSPLEGDEDKFRTIVYCHFREEQVQLLDLKEQGKYYEVNDKDKVKVFSRINAAIALFNIYPYFFNNNQCDQLGVSLFLHYPEQDEVPIRLYGTSIDLDEIQYVQIENYKQLFPFFTYEGSQIEKLYSRKYCYPKSFKIQRLSEDCCD